MDSRPSQTVKQWRNLLVTHIHSPATKSSGVLLLSSTLPSPKKKPITSNTCFIHRIICGLNQPSSSTSKTNITIKHSHLIHFLQNISFIFLNQPAVTTAHVFVTLLKMLGQSPLLFCSGNHAYTVKSNHTP